MEDIAARIDEARTLLEAGGELGAAQLLETALAETDDPELLERIHALAVEGHERVQGFRKIHWDELVLDSEQRLPHPVA